MAFHADASSENSSADLPWPSTGLPLTFHGLPRRCVFGEFLGGSIVHLAGFEIDSIRKQLRGEGWTIFGKDDDQDDGEQDEEAQVERAARVGANGTAAVHGRKEQEKEAPAIVEGAAVAAATMRSVDPDGSQAV